MCEKQLEFIKVEVVLFWSQIISQLKFSLFYNLSLVNSKKKTKILAVYTQALHQSSPVFFICKINNANIFFYTQPHTFLSVHLTLEYLML